MARKTFNREELTEEQNWQLTQLMKLGWTQKEILTDQPGDNQPEKLQNAWQEMIGTKNYMNTIASSLLTQSERNWITEMSTAIIEHAQKFG